MGTRKTVVRSFEDSLGLDLTSSNLTRDPSAAIEFKNIERLPNGSYRGREGFKILTQKLFVFGYHNYIYLDDDNVEQQELICLGSQQPYLAAANWPSTASLNESYCALYRLRQGELTISYSGSDSWSLEVYVDCATNTIKARLYDNDSVVLTKDLGTGLELSYTTLKDLADDIDALSNFSCFPDKSCIIDGAYTGSAPTVDAGHTLAKGDWLWTGDFSDSKEIVATTATTVTFVRGAAVFTDNQVLGHALFPAAILNLQKRDDSADASKTYSYSYWEYVPCLSIDFTDSPGTQKLPLGLFPLKDEVSLTAYGRNFAAQGQTSPSFVDHNNCVYFSADYASELPLKKLIGQSPYQTINFSAGTWKYDGKDLYMSGPVNVYQNYTSMPFSLAQTGAAGLANGSYKYQVSLLRKDFRQNEIESFFETIIPFTVTGGPRTVNLTIDHVNGGVDQAIPHRQFDMRYTNATATVSVAASTFSVTSGHLMRTGDTVYFNDNSGNFQTARITDWTQTTIVLDDEYTIANTNAISNYAYRVWRTKASGSEFFLAKEEPATVNISADQVIADSTADASLGINISNVKQTSIQYNFPRVASLDVHQGLLAGGGGGVPNDIVWEDALYIESVDYARAVAPTPTGSSAQINNILSTESSAIFIHKESDVYEAVGSLAASAVEVTSVVKNSYGASNAKCALQIEANIFTLSKLGVALRAGQEVVPDKTILSVFRDVANLGVPGLVPKKCYLQWDAVKNWVHIFLSFEEIEDDTGGSGNIYYLPTTSSRHFVLQLPQTLDQRPLMSEMTYSGVSHIPAVGMETHNDCLVFGSRYWDSSNAIITGATFCRLDRLGNANDADRFSDNGESYSWSFIPQWDDGDTPEYEKVWHEFELYQLQPESFVAAFDVTFESFRDWVLTSAKRDTQRTLSFSASTTTADKIQFDPGYKAKRRAIKLSGTVCKNPPVFTGYSYTVDDLERDKDKFGR